MQVGGGVMHAREFFPGLLGSAEVLAKHAPSGLSSRWDPMSSSSRILAVICLLTCACGPDAASQSSTEDTDTDTETGGECVLPQDDDSIHATATITIRNDASEPRYVLPKSQFNCNYPKLQIDIDGANVLWDHPGAYPQACNGDLCNWGCSDGGSMGLMINPGATATVEWNGAVWASEPVSEFCADLSCGGFIEQCDARRAYESVDYVARVLLSEQCPNLPECEACDQDVCEIFVYEPSAIETWNSIEAAATFPAGAEIVLD